MTECSSFCECCRSICKSSKGNESWVFIVETIYNTSRVLPRSKRRNRSLLSDKKCMVVVRGLDGKGGGESLVLLGSREDEVINPFGVS